MIVLSPNSVKSDWVKYELDNALKYLEDETLYKIIPIHYRSCEIPETLKPILNIDLTDEVLYIRDGNFEFLGDKYYQFLGSIVKSINQGNKELKSTDKDEIAGNKIITYPVDDEIILKYKIVGYKSISKFLTNQISPAIVQGYDKKDIKDFIPVVLPRQLSTYLGDLQFGDLVKFVNKDGNEIEGDFARFSTLNNRIAIPKTIREFLGVGKPCAHAVTIELSSKKIKIE
jgi:hypothetical protein